MRFIGRPSLGHPVMEPLGSWTDAVEFSRIFMAISVVNRLPWMSTFIFMASSTDPKLTAKVCPLKWQGSMSCSCSAYVSPPKTVLEELSESAVRFSVSENFAKLSSILKSNANLEACYRKSFTPPPPSPPPHTHTHHKKAYITIMGKGTTRYRIPQGRCSYRPAVIFSRQLILYYNNICSHSQCCKYYTFVMSWW